MTCRERKTRLGGGLSIGALGDRPMFVEGDQAFSMNASDDPDLSRFKLIVGLEIKKRRAIPLGVLGFILMGFDEYRAWGLLAAATGIGLFLYYDWRIGRLKAGL